MSEITIKDRASDKLKVEFYRGEIWVEVDRYFLSFTDPAELKRLAEWILENIEKDRVPSSL